MQATDDQGLSIEHGAGAPRHPDSRGALWDTSAIRQLIGKARQRIRAQWALEGATTAAILAGPAGLAVIFLMRTEVVTRSTGLALLMGTIGIVVAGALLKASRRIDDELVARRIDRASNLSDRLSTAIAFTRTAVAPEQGSGDETYDLMIAAIRDGVRAVPRAEVALATPFVAPTDLRAALGFIALSALAAGLALPTVDRTPHLYRVDPDHAAAGDDVVLKGANLMTGIARPIAALPVPSSIGTPNVPAEALAPPPPVTALHGFAPVNAAVYLGTGKARPALILDWSADQIVIRIPESAPIGVTTLTAWIGGDAVGPLAFTVVDRKDPTYHKADSVVLDPDDRAYLEALLSELRAVAKRDKVPELEDFAKQIEQLLKDAELGKISKEQLLDALAKAEDKMNKDAEPNQAEINKQMADMGKELSKDQTTKDLGDAMQKNDLEKAKQELEKLAEKLDQKQLSDKEKQQLAKQLEKVAQQMEQKDEKQEQEEQQLEEEILRLQKKKQEAKTEQEQVDTEQRLNKKKDELKKLQRDREDKEQSAQREALKRLTRDMEKAAENLQKPQKDPNEQKDQNGQKDQEQRDQQASQKLKDAARETGRVDQDQRKQATQKKMSSQMEDLREAMRRAKQKGNKGPQDPFGKQGKNQDFAQRSRGQKGQGQAWKPGQGQQPGQGQGQNGQGQGGQGQPGGQDWGTGHDDNLTGDPTEKSGNTKDNDLQGTQGKEGGGTRETILAAAQKGFATQRYRDVYGKYHQIVEDVMRTEKLPSSYKYYVKRYFAKIHPTTEAPPAAAPDGKHDGKIDGKADGKTEDKTP